MKITIYSTTTCPYCQMLKDYLDEKGVSYEEKLVDQNDDAKTEMMEKSGGYLGVPFTVITKEDAGEETVLGFDKAKIEGIIGGTK
jgi:glutaredoxin